MVRMIRHRTREGISLHVDRAKPATNVDLKNKLKAASNALATSLQFPFIICP